VDAARLLRGTNIPAAGFKVESFSDYLGILDIMTDITGNKDAYQKHGTEIKEKIDLLLSSQKPDTEKKILFIRAGTSAKATKAKSSESHFVAMMLSELGCHNIADDAPILLDGLSIEVVLKENPDMIFISSMGNESDVRAYMDSVFASELWQKLDAVKNEKYYYLPKDKYHFKPNADWYDAYLELWELLYETE